MADAKVEQVRGYALGLSQLATALAGLDGVADREVDRVQRIAMDLTAIVNADEVKVHRG